MLKDPKTKSSVRRVFLPQTVIDALIAARKEQDEMKALVADAYQDFNLVLAHDTGRPYEERQIAQKFKAFIKEAGLPPVVFHSLRHCSTSIKLAISNGNIKAVQGDTGHAQARMVTDVYAHTHDDVRRNLARKMEEDFFHKATSTQGDTAAPHDPSMAQADKLLQDYPQLAQMFLAAIAQLRKPK